MKKLFMFLAVAGLATFGTACSSSDDSNPPTPETLVVSSSKATPEVGETVTITVMEGKNDVSTTAEILVNGTKITGRTLKSDTAAEFKITAKKAGANDAAAITVKFVPKGTELKQLTLTATPATIELDAETVFKVTLDGADVTGTATIKVNGTAVTGAKYKGTTAGTFSAVASLAGAKDSAPFTITVNPKPVDPGAQPDNTILANNQTTAINVGYYELAMRNYNTSTPGEVVEGPSVYNYPGGGYANGFYVTVGYFDTAPPLDPTFYTFVLVKNPSIVVTNGSITDFGQVVLPSQTKDVAFGQGAISLNGAVTQSTSADAGTGSLDVKSLVLDPTTKEGTTSLTMTFTHSGKTFIAKYTGSTFLEEYNPDAAAKSKASSRKASSLVKHSAKPLNLKFVK